MRKNVLTYVLLISLIFIVSYLWNVSTLKALNQVGALHNIITYPIFSISLFLNFIIILLFVLIIYLRRDRLLDYYKKFFRSLVVFGSLQQHYFYLTLSFLILSSLLYNYEFFQTAFLFNGDYVIIIFVLFALIPFIKKVDKKFCDNIEVNSFNDAPIKTFDEDKLSFIEEVEKITTYILTFVNGQDAVSVELRGSWGSGKTSLINLLQVYLQDQKKSGKISSFNRIRSININVAKYENVPLLYVHFFYELIKNLEQDYLLPRIDVNVILSNAIEKLLRGINISALQNRIMKLPKIEVYLTKISEWLCVTNSVFICYLDDIDRLNLNEVEGVLKLIRLIKNNMKNVILICAADMRIYKQYYNKNIKENNEYV